MGESERDSSVLRTGDRMELALGKDYNSLVYFVLSKDGPNRAPPVHLVGYETSIGSANLTKPGNGNPARLIRPD